MISRLDAPIALRHSVKARSLSSMATPTNEDSEVLRILATENQLAAPSSHAAKKQVLRLTNTGQ